MLIITSGDHSLNVYLINNKGFSGKGAAQFISAYRETIKIANLGDKNYTVPSEERKDLKPTVNLPTIEEIKGVTESGMNQDTFTLDEGQVVLQWPKVMSKESLEDFESWIKLVVKKAKRSSGKLEQKNEITPVD